MTHHQRLQNAIHYIEQNLDHPIALCDVSKAAFSSLSYFHRIFYFMTDLTLKEYIRKRRLSKSAYQLHCTTHSITDIALNAGYETHEAFTRAFKKHYGMSPRTFRQTQQELPLFERLDIMGQYATQPSVNLDFTLTPKQVLYKEVHIQGFQTHTTLEGGQQAIDICRFANDILAHKKLDAYFNLKHTPTFGLYTNMTDESDFDYTIGCLESVRIKTRNTLVSHTIPSGHYTKFHLNRLDRIKEAWQYIYGSWFPRNNAYRAPGFDFEIYHPDSVDIYIPMKV